ncbi:MAG: thioredoxin family protein [Actinomycetota bacterium]|nr:thioredoxin family protein [Actinomycetota bacterium]
MKPLVEGLRDKYRNKANFEFYDVSVTSNISIAEQFGVQAIPTLVFIDKNGNEVNRLIGETDKSVVEQYIQQISN